MGGWVARGGNKKKPPNFFGGFSKTIEFRLSMG
jgi:hypothetical protein